MKNNYDKNYVYEQIIRSAGFLTDAFSYGEYDVPSEYIGKLYHYIPAHGYQNILDFLKKYGKGCNFLDVGCGIGDKLFLADVLYGQCKSVTGIEINKTYFNIANYLKRLNACDYTLKQADALEYDYSDYNFIYMYHPIQDRNLYLKLISRILETAKPNTFLLEMLHRGDDLTEDNEYRMSSKILFQVLDNKLYPIDKIC